MKCLLGLATLALIALAPLQAAQARPPKAGDIVTPQNSSMVSDLLSPGNFILVQRGMRMKIVASQGLEWPPPYKAATEKFSSQVHLGPDGELVNYVAGLPFPVLDINSPEVAVQVMWNFSFRPQYTDDVDLRYVEVTGHAPGGAAQSSDAHFTIGHFGFYNNIGRTEVPPLPTDPEANDAGIRYRFGAFPFLEPQEIRGLGLIRYRSKDPSRQDSVWYVDPASRHLRRIGADSTTDLIEATGLYRATSNDNRNTYATNLDPDSYFGFSGKIEDFNFRLLAVKPMLASVHGENSPARNCGPDDDRAICPEAWEMRRLYVIEATAKPRFWSQMIDKNENTIPRRVLYIDSEGWFITASDLYDRAGHLWKTIVTFNTYRDRPVPDAKIALFPYKRIFQTALVDQDLQSGFSSTVFMPGQDSEEHECWYINMGVVTKGMLNPDQMTRTGH